jgi:hypothetical protein
VALGRSPTLDPPVLPSLSSPSSPADAFDAVSDSKPKEGRSDLELEHDLPGTIHLDDLDFALGPLEGEGFVDLGS